MKTTLFSILFIGFSMQLAHAEAIQGAQYLNQWSGDYKVTECTQCTNFAVTSGENLKNLVDVGVGVFPIPATELLQCAQTNYFLGFSYTIRKDNALPNDGMSVSHDSGQCDWSATVGESLIVTPDSFVYEAQNGSQGTLMILIKKLPDGTYLINRHETDPTPSWGLPGDWSFEVKATFTPNAQ